MMAFVATALARMRDDLLRGAGGGLTRGGCRAAIGAADAQLGPLVEQTGEIDAARLAFLQAVESYTGGTSLSAALNRTPAEDETLLDAALAALGALGRALEDAEPTAQARRTQDTAEVPRPAPRPA